MTTNSLLQGRINELNSGILNYVENRVYITGFYNAERLNSHLDRNIQNWSSKGLYDKEEITFFNIKNEALFIVYENGVLVKQYQFIQVYKEIVQYKNKIGSVTITIRKNNFGNQFNLLVGLKSYEFPSKYELSEFLNSNFKDINDIVTK
ncbi:hypothetical protein FH508_0013095 [Lysinibacillus sp. CD3-6]|uniref:hypothetical protein n=1 Tax=Lysinibacillus TaxID=400634 RepID=UPI0011758FB9|nr:MULTISPECIES: hypothetical protein [Lysinibacillus]MCS1384790.1 hypothetical protein [Lysinibacillus sphaericus]UED78402.1 hypothetical protein FH508_0013095 [Lysinibacillus sp. CD3-6]